MGFVSNVAGWIAVALILVVFAGGLAVVSGYLLIGDPGAAAGQLASGDVAEPNVTIENVRFEGAGGGVQGTSVETAVTARFDVVINNTRNEIGGSVDEVDYEIALSGRRRGPFQRVGDGVMRGVTVPPAQRVAEEGTFQMNAVEMAEALGGSLDTTSTYMRVKGNATVAFGPFGFTIPFEDVERVEFAEERR